ncbi:unnamed protein product [Paramecium sonneborni]|uniref:RBR-type E3 ubiquitin transferase n=1 Tax=Paramecium sonneborni TaxID=65129 RepID=A0A8S1Q9M1_9CILI|nr:unnamed protein product [Paramecium sonneborni]
MNSNNHNEQLCQYEQQKPRYQHFYLELYKSKILQIHGPKLQQSDTLKCQQNNGEQLSSADDPIYLDIQDEKEQEIQFELLPRQQQSQEKNKAFQNFLKKYSIIKRFGIRRLRQNESSDELESQEKSDEISQNQKEYKECQICLSQRKMNQYLPCKHEFCKSCVGTHLKENIIRGNVMIIQCPQLSCSEQFQKHQIKELVSRSLYEKYERFYSRQQISQNKNVRWCPRVDCEQYVIGTGNDQLICSCGQQICFKCGNEYHLNISCEQAMDTQYLKVRKELQVNNCPNCQAPIEKRGGCNHMTCYKCKYEFCWICHGKYSSAHYGIFNIFGCAIPGGQVSNIKPLNNPMLIRIMMIIPKLILTLLLSIGLLILLPFFILYLIISAPYQIVKRISNFRINNCSKCSQIAYFILYLFIGSILSPITIICAILISPLLLINYIIDNL